MQQGHWIWRDVCCYILTPHKLDSITNTMVILEPSEREGQVQPLSLEGLQLQSEGTRRMSHLETISVSWVICNTWAGVSATVSLAISQGGPVTLIYGVIAMFILGGACAMTLAELASVYPTAGGQYHWTSILAPKSTSRILVCSDWYQ